MKIGDICESVSVPFRKKIDKVVLINTSDILDGKVINHTHVPNKNLRGQFKKSFQLGDILFSEIRPKNRRFALVDFDASDYIASTKLMVLRANERVLPLYLYYVLTSEQILNQLQLLAETRSGTFPQITFSEMASLDVYVPPIEEQREIISILSPIDDKIAINTAINQRLEQIAQAIFKSWFVDFEPFGGEMPRDWQEGTLGDISNISSGKRPVYRQTDYSDEVNIPILGASSIMGYTNAALYNEKVLVTGRVGTHGVIQRYSRPCWPSDNTLVLKSQFFEFTYQQLLIIDFRSMNRGSTQPLITQTDLKNVPILIPNETTLLEFEELAGSLMAQQEANILENEYLATIRDTLLPRLMSGELTVADLKDIT